MSDSIENVLVKLMRDNNTHIDKSNKSQLVTNDLVKSLVDKFDKVMTQNKELEKLVIDLSNEHIYLTGKIETMEKEYKDQLDIIRVSTIATENMVMDMHRVKKPKVSKPVNVEPRVQCKCLTKKGDQCKKYCIPDHDTCKQHANMEVSSKPVPKDEPETLIPTPTPTTQPVVIVKKRRKTPKPVKVKPPLHNHEPGETPTEPCELCISHGDILDPEMPDHEYKCLDVNGLSLEERLRIVVENEENGNPEDPEEPEEPEEPEDPGIGNDNWADMVDEDNNV
jgi:hypothetical protein